MDSSFELDIPPPAPPCSGCFEALSLQFRLDCHHSLCQPCLQHCKTQDKVECPECQHITNMTEVEEIDSNVNETLDESYLFSQDDADQSYSSMMSNVGFVTTECGRCKIVKKVTVKCLDCKQCMCAECRVLHKQVLVNRGHTLESVEEVIRKVQIDLEEVATQLEERDDVLKLKLYEETRFIDDLKNMDRKVIEDINSHRKELKSKIDAHHDDLINEVQAISDKVVGSSNERKDTINLSIEETATCLRLVSDSTTDADFSYLLQDGKRLQDDTLAKIKGIDERMIRLKAGTIPRLLVIGPKPWLGERDGTSFDSDEIEQSRSVSNKDVAKKSESSEPVEPVKTIQRLQSFDSGNRRNTIHNDDEIQQTPTISRFRRYDSLDSVSTRKVVKQNDFERETSNIKRNVNIQDIIERLKMCATPKKHDTSPRDLPRRSQSFTSTRPVLKENLKLDGSPVLSKSRTPGRSQSFTRSSNSWANGPKKEDTIENESILLSSKQSFDLDKSDAFVKKGTNTTAGNDTQQGPLYNAQPKETAQTTENETQKQLVYKPKPVPESQSHLDSVVKTNKSVLPDTKIKTEAQTLKSETTSKPAPTKEYGNELVGSNRIYIPKKSNSFNQRSTYKSEKPTEHWATNRQTSDPTGSDLAFSKSVESGINTWGSSNSVSATSEASIKSYSSFSDLSDIDGYVNPISGLPLDLSQLNDDTEKPNPDTSLDEDTRDSLENGTSTPISNIKNPFASQEHSRGQLTTSNGVKKEAAKLLGPKKITSDQIRNMVSSMASPRQSSNTQDSGFRGVSLSSPRRLNIGYQSGFRKAPLSAPRSYSTGVIHTITETEQDVENTNWDKQRHSKFFNRSLSLNIAPSNGNQDSTTDKYDQKGNDKPDPETIKDNLSSKVPCMVNPIEAKENSSVPTSNNSAIPKGILKQTKDSKDIENEGINHLRLELHIETEEVVESPRHTIYSPRLNQNTFSKDGDRSIAKTIQQELQRNFKNSSHPKTKMVTENEDAPSETIKNSPRFMDIFHQLSGDELSEPLTSSLKSPRRVHVLKSQVKFVEEEKQKMKANKASKNVNKRMVNGSSLRVPNPGLSKTMPVKLPSSQFNGTNTQLCKKMVNSKENNSSSTETVKLENGSSYSKLNSDSCENDFTQMEDMKYTVGAFSQLPFRPFRVYMIDDTLWCSALSGLHIYDVNCKFVKSIKHPNLRHCRAIVKTTPNEIVVGCADKYGLVSLDLNGEFKSQVISGCFPNVNFHQQQLFALEFNKNEILILGVKNDEWQGIKVLKLNYSYNCSLHDIMQIHNGGTIYLSSGNENCILQFDPEGNLVSSCGQYGQGEAAGRLYDPRLCKLDVHGNAMVADYWNQRIQVCSKAGDWYLVDMAGDLRLALDAVVDQELKTIWVIARNNKLMKFVTIK